MPLVGNEMKLFAYYFCSTFTAASLGYFLLRAAFGEGVFGALFRMFLYHRQHPFQYIALACSTFAVVAAFFTPRVAQLASAPQVLAIFSLMLGSIVIASVPGGVLWSIHDMQAGYFPGGERFWRALACGASSGLQVGWLIIALSFPFNLLGLITGYFITLYGLRLAKKTTHPTAR